MHAIAARLLALPVLLALAGCGGERTQTPPPAGEAEAADANGFTAPTGYTPEAQAAVGRALALDDPQDFEDAKRGLIASDPNLVIAGPDGTPIWDPKSFDFVQGDAPPSVNPSLWRQAKLNGVHG